MGTSAYERTRRKFRPERTCVLFIGESRPTNDTFFYYGNSNLASYTREAFERVYGKFQGMNEFLWRFHNFGCYLVDLCSEPVNRLPASRRKRERNAGVPELASVIRELDPNALIVVMKGIEPFVSRAAEVANASQKPQFVLPFPAQGHQREYVERLSRAVASLRSKGEIRG